MTQSSPNEDDAHITSEAVSALRRLGLSKYEAEVFVALKKLGRGTARDIADITSVPRSQVYGATDNLLERGLIDIQQTTPKQFRPVSIGDAEATLKQQQEAQRRQAFDFLEAVKEQQAPSKERQEDIWTVSGQSAVTARITSLIHEGSDWVVYMANEASHSDVICEEIAAVVDRLDVRIVSTDDAVIESFEGLAVETYSIPDELAPNEWPAARGVVVDGDAVLISVIGGDRVDSTDESAFWSQETEFAGVLIQLIDGWFGSSFEL